MAVDAERCERGFLFSAFAARWLYNTDAPSRRPAIVMSRPSVTSPLNRTRLSPLVAEALRSQIRSIHRRQLRNWILRRPNNPGVRWRRKGVAMRLARSMRTPAARGPKSCQAHWYAEHLLRKFRLYAKVVRRRLKCNGAKTAG